MGTYMYKSGLFFLTEMHKFEFVYKLFLIILHSNLSFGFLEHSILRINSKNNLNFVYGSFGRNLDTTYTDYELVYTTYIYLLYKVATHKDK